LNIHNNLPVAREGLPFIIIPLALALGAVPVGWWLFLPLAVFGLFSAWFFRDPDRLPPAGDLAVLSPADGTVINVEDVDENRYLHDSRIKISIFMSIFNVHVNRTPMTGRVVDCLYTPGKYLAANLDKASLENEHNAIILETRDGQQLVFVQIAGLIARRIACWIKPGDHVVRGQRIGLIRFGSRLDVYLPRDARIDVKVRDKVRAGESILAYMP
jgi:phosphatidylserine decarboxylase